MAGTDEDRDLAAEYALGTLDAAERAAFEARIAGDVALAAEVAGWQERLVPLNEQTAAISPPAITYTKILERIDGQSNVGIGNVIHLKRRIAVWRGAAIAVSAIAAALVLFVTMRGEWFVARQPLYVAVLQSPGKEPAFVAAVDVRNKVMIVRSLDTHASADHSYELWALGAGRATPQPLGVVETSIQIPIAQLGNRALGDTTLAVSLEPVGGSPTGLPTGPVLFTGKLLSTR